jgi:CubicO group peptidase (beta-lactamase class C family)
LSGVLRADVDAAVVPGAVALIMRGGKLAYFEAFGYADRQLLRPMQRDSIFRIASMTKPMTAVAALILMEQGKLVLLASCRSSPLSKWASRVSTPPANGA